MNLTNIGYIQEKIPDENLKQLRDSVNYIQNNFSSSLPANTALAGNIAREYFLPENVSLNLEEILKPYLKKYCEEFSYPLDRKLKLIEPWVNFQKKYEFNPIHDHTGEISFVLWLQVPYSIEDELKNSPGKYSNTKVTGSFGFVYTDVIGKVTTHSIPADRSYEGTLLMFPAQLHHMVYPFYTSDDYRISIAGNYYVK